MKDTSSSDSAAKTLAPGTPYYVAPEIIRDDQFAT
jgi:hypothetical protein